MRVRKWSQLNLCKNKGKIFGLKMTVRLLASTLVLLLTLVSTSEAAVVADACWEKCFQTVGTENFVYEEVYENLFEIANDITAIKDIFGITKLGFLIDSAISQRHNVANDVFDGVLQNGTEIFQLQVLLAKAIALMVNGQRNYVVQYDETGAWTCNEHSCLTNCGTMTVLNNQITKVEMNATSSCAGNIEAACSLLNAQMTDIYCTAFTVETMVIAIVNGDFLMSDPFKQRRTVSEDHDKNCPYHDVSCSSSSSEEDFYSPCRSYFNQRYLIGTHSSTKKVMEFFPSMYGKAKYFHAHRFSLDALQSLVTCMNSGCCPTATAITLKNCTITQGRLGELILPYQTHPAFSP